MSADLAPVKAVLIYFIDLAPVIFSELPRELSGWRRLGGSLFQVRCSTALPQIRSNQYQGLQVLSAQRDVRSFNAHRETLAITALFVFTEAHPPLPFRGWHK
jgi:hypothetical protein